MVGHIKRVAGSNKPPLCRIASKCSRGQVSSVSRGKRHGKRDFEWRMYSPIQPTTSKGPRSLSFPTTMPAITPSSFHATFLRLFLPGYPSSAIKRTRKLSYVNRRVLSGGQKSHPVPSVASRWPDNPRPGPTVSFRNNDARDSFIFSLPEKIVAPRPRTAEFLRFLES